MTPYDFFAQTFGIIGLVLIVYSFQCKKNKNFFLFQGLGGLFFFVNFLMLGAYAGALFNLIGLVRALFFAGKKPKLYSLILINSLFLGAFIFSLTLIWGNLLQIVLSTFTFASIFTMSIFMYLGNGKHIRYFQFSVVSPSWLIYNIFNFSIGGIICEIFNILSVIVSFIRFGKDGFEKINR